MKKAIVLSMTLVSALLAPGDEAGAQIQIRKPQLGVYGGLTIPRGNFKEETDIGWNAGVLLKVRVTGAFDLRLDGMYTPLGSKNVEFANATVHSESNVALASILAELNLGPDSAAYPGDNSVSPYINAGPAFYRYKFDGTCTRSCEGFADNGEETKVGFNIGAGANVPFRGIPLFAELRYHRFSTIYPIRQVSSTATLVTVSVGFKIR